MSDEELLENWRRGSLRKMFQVLLDEPISRKDMDSEYKLKKLLREATLVIHPDKAERNERAINIATEMYTELKIKYEKKLKKIKEQGFKGKEPDDDLLEIEDMKAFRENERLELLKKRLKKQAEDRRGRTTQIVYKKYTPEELEEIEREEREEEKLFL